MVNTTTNTFGYNSKSELIDAAMGLDDYGYNYDQIGNRIKALSTVDSVTSEMDYLSNALNQYTNIVNGTVETPMYDLDGNMLTNGDWTYTWNGENRLITATNTVDNTYITYSYDYQGRMIKKVTDGETTLFYWNGNYIIAEMTDSSTNFYTWANGETLTASLDGETVFYCHDANKNVTDLVDDTGTHLVHYDYSPFGVQSFTLHSSPFTVSLNPFRFSNEYFDDTTGFVEYKYRKYNPYLGKFLSRDPIGVQGGLNLYAICNNDLINKVDIYGLWPGWTLCEDAGEDDIWVDDDWKDIGYIPTDQIGGSGGYVTYGVIFRWIRTFKRKYICDNCEEKWAEGVKAYKHEQDAIIVYLDGSTWPPNGKDIDDVWSLIVDAAGNAIPFSGQPADLSSSPTPYAGKEPNQNTVGRIVKSPKTPYTVHW
jgi:RHS repeat-associated protein